MKKYTFFIIALTLFHTNCFAQLLVDTKKENFAFEIKQIDEFIDRFNDTKGNLAEKYWQEQHNNQGISRVDNLKSVFNLQNPKWNTEQLNTFINEMTNAKKPHYISFYDKDWYAELQCQFTYKGKAQKATLILENQVFPGKKSKWVVMSVKAPFLPSTCGDNKVPQSTDPTQCLNPMVHGTDFMGLRRAFENKQQLSNYFCHQCYAANLLDSFAYELYSGNLKLVQVDKVTYHFLELDNWIFTVEQFRRNNANSGWLISSLLPSNANVKYAYKANTLSLLGE